MDSSKSWNLRSRSIGQTDLYYLGMSSADVMMNKLQSYTNTSLKATSIQVTCIIHDLD